MSLTRRNFLKVNGAVLTLPFMPSLAGEIKKGEKPAKKLAMMYIPNGIVRRGFFPGEEEATLPGFVGGFNADKTKNKVRKQNTPGIHKLEFTSTQQPLKEHHKDVTLVTGMDRTFKNGQDVHAQGASCYLTSVSPEQAAEKGWKYPNGRSLDQVIGDRVGRGNILKTLEISCNGFAKPKEDIYFNNISWYGPGKIAPSIKDPQKLYERLFMADSYQSHLTEVTDLVLEDAKSLSRKLGNEDKQTLNEFMEMIRNIEIRIARQKKMINDADIRIPKNEILPRGEYIKLQADLMLLAFQMGITNISTFMIGPERWDATLLYEGVFPKPVQHHNMTHNQKGNGWKELQKIDIFHMEQYAYVISRMKEIKEADGSSMLDNSLVTYGAALGDGATHQFFDLPFMIAGKGQDQIKQGRFIQCKSGTLNSNMWLSLAKLMGVEMDSFADSNDVISDLWT
ncbi:MAG: hypothetical protein CMO59_11345 [Verrucomicrobiales bacterium]|jgi:hypothetical protein|nr:hypothetical protein [Verrucomicrobiales bacterium]MBT16560.1 hypothetical protein [Verrucomicrobiales bacterium]MEC9042340.1 DUF1552 domain-containing protein [Verrucomicrobiota bacterium]MED5258228.1 DUF1552 domain-containing protein [Verrucomicrobiota bacterium]MEE2725081.1 DUF1552 domain-containing protein [Verrucomicrobiota bacterium]|tara:strand:+ start:68 stop:1423 length:1356 start_codon:yes stop_codon:yes gene_type:complete